MINNIRMSRIFILLFSIGLLASCDKASFPSEAKAPIDHVIWDDLLQIHVDTNGWVDYKGLAKDKEKLNEYLRLLSENHPNTDWSEAQRKAYWINAYNAFTVKLIVDHYPSLAQEHPGPLPAQQVRFLVCTPSQQIVTETQSMGGHPDVIQPRIAKGAMKFLRSQISGSVEVDQVG